MFMRERESATISMAQEIVPALNIGGCVLPSFASTTQGTQMNTLYGLFEENQSSLGHMHRICRSWDITISKVLDYCQFCASAWCH